MDSFPLVCEANLILELATFELDICRPGIWHMQNEWSLKSSPCVWNLNYLINCSKFEICYNGQSFPCFWSQFNTWICHYFWVRLPNILSVENTSGTKPEWACDLLLWCMNDVWRDGQFRVRNIKQIKISQKKVKLSHIENQDRPSWDQALAKEMESKKFAVRMKSQLFDFL